ncbi:unnamed protein product [Acanthoscelides obtectus]|uniref:Uncharacterized protein n=1 Tax=Acanthoscelides obtectus TaxID=200917 RepID=A0A9P0NZX0_ACAOB|nr:unnamed protein product [Acanthoscelides obtectus]CAK1663974.1 hypothetical protein AOBTE_LOCUS23970 [Acanthoscelides obtectus]
MCECSCTRVPSPDTVWRSPFPLYPPIAPRPAW